MSTMTSRVLLTAVIIAACILLVGGLTLGATAASEKKAHEVTLVGTIVAVYDDADVLEEVILETTDQTYDIVIDDRGRKLAEEKDGQSVRVTGSVKEDESGVLWLTVSKYESEE